MNQSGFIQRLADIQRFCTILKTREIKVGGTRTLEESDAGVGLPERGVYFFFEPGEVRTTSGDGLRVVRVGTHALKVRSKRTLWDRLRTHRGYFTGQHPGGGNHRASIFRLHVGTALINRDHWQGSLIETWGKDHHSSRDICQVEYPLEVKVSEQIRFMPFLWFGVDDASGPQSDRAIIECNAIALLSNYHAGDQPIDPPSTNWLGHHAKSEKVRLSGLWNSKCVDHPYDPGFLDLLQGYI